MMIMMIKKAYHRAHLPSNWSFCPRGLIEILSAQQRLIRGMLHAKPLVLFKTGAFRDE